jgi:phosphotransferase system enzyme I (PtsI)
MINGIGASDGISIGKIYKYNQVELVIVKEAVMDTIAEIEKFNNAIAKSEIELKEIQDRTEKNVDAETAAIFGAHIEILNDPELSDSVCAKIIDEHVNADYALKEVSDTFVLMFESMENEYFRERAADIKDVTTRVLTHIQGIETSSLAEINEEVIVVAKDLTPSDTAQLNKALVKGFITDVGGRTSHSAIMARTLEIPAVVGTKDGFSKLETGDKVILNGSTGEIILNPSKEEIDTYMVKIEAYEKEKALWQQFKDKNSLTKDGVHLEIGSNIGSPEDLEGVISHGSDCIGLYRTEFLYMGKSDYPNEEEQYNAYKTVLEKMNGKPVVVRTLDIGGDKELSYLKMDHELNPFLGNRALRLCFNMPEVFNTQLRALLRSSVHGNLHIMFPMIATVGELRKAKEFVANVHKDLVAEGISVSDSYKIGIMVEIPAAAIIADILAKEVDFFSIGTNDLIQYTFAADRMNEKVSYLYQPFNPSLLRLLDMIIKAAHKEGKWVGMCGEMAGEIKALPVLIGLGLDEFSMSASGVLRARYLAKKIDSQDAGQLADEALKCGSQEEVMILVDSYLEKLD